MKFKNSTKLVFFVNCPNFFLSHRLELALRAKDDGHEVHVIAPKTGKYIDIQKKGINFHEIKLIRSKFKLFSEISSMYRLNTLLNYIQPNIIHNVTIKPILYGTFVSLFHKSIKVVNAISGFGYIFSTHSIKTQFLKFFLLIFFKILFLSKRVWVIVQNSDDRYILNSKKIIPESRIVLIKGSGVNLKEFPIQHKYPKEKNVVLMSRMLWDKGVGEFVEAAKSIQTKHSDINFFLVGDPDVNNPQNIDTKQLQTWHNSGVIKWIRHTNDQLEIFKMSTIVCLPSYREGLPKVLLEAASCAKAIIATDVPGCREIVKHNINGILVPCKDSNN